MVPINHDRRTNVNDERIEQEIQAKGLTGPRVMPQDIEANIVTRQFHHFPGTTVTVCCLGLRNGFTVIGESACASPENFDEELGRKIAYENAKQKIWPLMGYHLRQMLHEQELQKRPPYSPPYTTDVP